MQKRNENEIDIHLEHLPEDALKGIAEKAENKIGNYDTVTLSESPNTGNIYLR